MTTTLGQATGRGGFGTHRRSFTGEPGVAVRSTSISLGMVGFLALVASAWGGIVPFVGPTFGFSADGAASWYWNLSHVVLALIPGALGCLVALTFLAPVNATVTRRRLSLTTAGIIGIASGAWFVIGPLAWPVLVNTHSYFLAATPLRMLEYQVGYALGTRTDPGRCAALSPSVGQPVTIGLLRQSGRLETFPTWPGPVLASWPIQPWRRGPPLPGHRLLPRPSRLLPRPSRLLPRPSRWLRRPSRLLRNLRYSTSPRRARSLEPLRPGRPATRDQLRLLSPRRAPTSPRRAPSRRSRSGPRVRSTVSRVRARPVHLLFRWL